MSRDLRTFLREWEEEHPEEVVTVNKEVSVKWEVSVILSKLEKSERYPVVIYRRVVDDKGRKFDYPVVTNVFASRKRVAELLNAPPERVGMEYYKRIQKKRKPKVVGRERAPVKEVVLEGKDADLHRLPFLWHHEKDPSPYITAGLAITWHPETKIDNAAFHRGQIKGRRKIGVYLGVHTHNHLNAVQYEERGRPVPCAFWIGHHPLALMGAQARLGYPESHYESSGGMLGEPLRVVKSEALGDGFYVPADAEMIIEGYIRPNYREAEGPFGEYTRYYGPQRVSRVLDVECITMRKDAFLHDIFVGHADNHIIGSLPLEGRMYEALRSFGIPVKDVHMPLYGAGREIALISIHKNEPGQGKNAAAIALCTDHRIKYAFVFDDDIDVFDVSQVLWAFSTRTILSRDAFTIPGMTGHGLEPAIAGVLMDKAGIDCTMPSPEYPGAPRNFPEPIALPENLVTKMKLEDYISGGALNKIPREGV